MQNPMGSRPVGNLTGPQAVGAVGALVLLLVGMSQGMSWYERRQKAEALENVRVVACDLLLTLPDRQRVRAVLVAEDGQGGIGMKCIGIGPATGLSFPVITVFVAGAPMPSANAVVWIEGRVRQFSTTVGPAMLLESARVVPGP